jgi:ribose 5-phosphate isomerase RpiB
MEHQLCSRLNHAGTKYPSGHHQGVEDDDMKVACLGGKVIGSALALEPIKIFLTSNFSAAARHRRRLQKVQALETENSVILRPFERL